LPPIPLPPGQRRSNSITNPQFAILNLEFGTPDLCASPWKRGDAECEMMERNQQYSLAPHSPASGPETFQLNDQYPICNIKS
jgi:hypothetical protein